MVGHIEQRCIETALLALEKGHGLAQDMVGIEHRIVIGIHDALAIALAQLARVTGGFEASESCWVALEIGWPMVAEHVQDHYRCGVRGFDD